MLGNTPFSPKYFKDKNNEDTEKAKKFPIEDLYPYDMKVLGDKYIGICPFHEEKTPSFVIYANTNTFFCFGCKAHGDSIAFYMKLNNCDFKKALEELA